MVKVPETKPVKLRETEQLETSEIRELAEKQVPSEEQSEPCEFSEMLNDLDYAKMYLDLVAKELKKAVDEYKLGENVSYITEDNLDMVFRNGHWMQTLSAEFLTGNAFAVVGKHHLFGNQGLISLLKQQGFSVKRLSEDPRPSERWIQWRR